MKVVMLSVLRSGRLYPLVDTPLLISVRGRVDPQGDSKDRRIKSIKHSKSKIVKCTLVHALSFCTGRTAHRGSRSIDLPFLDHGTRWGRGKLHALAALPPEKTR